ncbi:uncharacterized protein LOC113005292 isoform X3 [Solenopsis invicta]|uniref:uncharacterized protein LOC113005292 isoform X3 n=1 Tax=Solenopsis invicta TaxID=13686 RepID=UPI00193DBE21|nr:uncharacterized protein LOC113005292 isoform X3 [Solenopsis invicta]
MFTRHARSEQEFNIPIIIEDSVSQLTPVNLKESLGLKETLKDIKRMVAGCSVILRDNNERLKKLEDAIKNRTLQVANEENFIVQCFPISSIENIKNMKNMLTDTKETNTQFKRFLLKIGGSNPRDNIQRILKNIFTNKCAMDCSWKERKENLKICNLQLTKIMKREVLSRHVSLTRNSITLWQNGFDLQCNANNEKIRKMLLMRINILSYFSGHVHNSLVLLEQ